MHPCQTQHFRAFFFTAPPLCNHMLPPGPGLPSPNSSCIRRRSVRRVEATGLVVRCALRLRALADDGAAGGAAWRGRGVRCAVPSSRSRRGRLCPGWPASAARPIGRKIRRPEIAIADRCPLPPRSLLRAAACASVRTTHRVAPVGFSFSAWRQQQVRGPAKLGSRAMCSRGPRSWSHARVHRHAGACMPSLRTRARV
jgi:hypothetical protein